jgi:hypothetical protein
MKKIIFLTAALFCCSLAFSQKIKSKLKFEQGQTLELAMNIKTSISQQAMGQAIDFNVDAGAGHSYKVTNVTDDNTTLNHAVQRIHFSFDGMGQKMKFDSKEEKDLNGQFGKPVKDILEKKYDIIIDPTGKTLMAVPEKVQLAETEGRMAILTGMLKEVLDLVQPPQKDKASFFAILPDKEVGKGDTWTSTTETAGGRIDAAYVLSSISDSAILVDFVESSVTVTKAEMMGSEIRTTMNNKSTGKIILDPVTFIIREKTISTESNGTAESSFGNMPVTSKTTTVITVKPVAGN